MFTNPEPSYLILKGHQIDLNKSLVEGWEASPNYARIFPAALQSFALLTKFPWAIQNMNQLATRIFSPSVLPQLIHEIHQGHLIRRVWVKICWNGSERAIFLLDNNSTRLQRKDIYIYVYTWKNILLLSISSVPLSLPIYLFIYLSETVYPSMLYKSSPISLIWIAYHGFLFRMLKTNISNNQQKPVG